MRKKKWIRFFQRLNPRELATEVHVYGYDFSWKSHVQLLLCSLGAIGAVGFLFQLRMKYLVIVMGIVIFLLPVFIISTYQKMFEQKRFADAAIYIEQMLYSFQKREKIVSALKETGEAFEEGRMKGVIEDAVSYLETGIANSEIGTAREALAIVERAYPCIKIHVAHELFISSEENGGESKNSILLLLDDIEHWKRRGYQLQADKKRSNTDNIISIVVATMMCAIALYVLNAMGALFPGAEGINIFTIEVIQISSFLFLIIMLFTLTKSVKSLTTNWLQNGEVQNQAYLMTCYETVTKYNDRKRLAWHRIGYEMARRDLSDALYMELPQWLMRLALLLQNNNVQVSIAKSIPDASSILQIELEKLMERLQNAPDKLSSYTDFCKAFDVPQAQSVMKMLHAISESGTGDTTVQINNLVSCVQKM